MSDVVKRVGCINPTSLRTAKFLWSFGHSECIRVKQGPFQHITTHSHLPFMERQIQCDKRPLTILVAGFFSFFFVFLLFFLVLDGSI